MCKNWRERGDCKYGDKCLFAHGEDELTKRGSAKSPEKKAEKTKDDSLNEERKSKISEEESTTAVST